MKSRFDHDEITLAIIQSMVSEGQLNGLRHEIGAGVRREYAKFAEDGSKVTKLDEELEIERRIGQRLGFRAHCLASGILEATDSLAGARDRAIRAQEAGTSEHSAPVPPPGPLRRLRARLSRLAGISAAPPEESPQAA